MELTKKHIITIAGQPGSGKSTAAKAVAAHLGYEHVSGGDLYRAIGRQQGLDVLQANLANEQSGEIDRQVDDKLEQINATDDRMVIDSRTAWHFIPTSYKVFLEIDLLMAAERILVNMTPERRHSEHVPDDPAEYAEQLKRRMLSEARRYQNLYQIDPYDMANYDLIIDAGVNDPGEVMQRILDGFQAWMDEPRQVPASV